MAEIEGLHLCCPFLPVQSGQGQQVVDQGVRAPDLRTDISQVFIFPDLLFQYLGVGRYDGQWRFQFMAGVGDKLFLPGEGFLHRLYHPPDQQCSQQGKQDAGCRRDQDG